MSPGWRALEDKRFASFFGVRGSTLLQIFQPRTGVCVSLEQSAGSVYGSYNGKLNNSKCGRGHVEGRLRSFSAGSSPPFFAAAADAARLGAPGTHGGGGRSCWTRARRGTTAHMYSLGVLINGMVRQVEAFGSASSSSLDGGEGAGGDAATLSRRSREGGRRRAWADETSPRFQANKTKPPPC